ncbi:hypothetical protein TCON_0447 [Astathelohania contejeani]|uniref:Uncharacterized protein n=1 Tax=Astathelohania contejeani TaxID=164912 RepID=A0ABQ7I1R3_9MICR|nr:hypothetical protein TCON_0447 [Thelohania contejeani]
MKSNTSTIIPKSNNDDVSDLSITEVIEKLDDISCIITDNPLIVARNNKLIADLSNCIANSSSSDINKIKNKINDLIKPFIEYLINKTFYLGVINTAFKNINSCINYLYVTVELDKIENIYRCYTYVINNSNKTIEMYNNVILSWNVILQKINDVNSISEFKNIEIAKEEDLFSDDFIKVSEDLWVSLCFIKKHLNQFISRWHETQIKTSLDNYNGDNLKLWNNVLEISAILLFYCEDLISCMNCIKKLENMVVNDRKLLRDEKYIKNMEISALFFERNYERLIKSKEKINNLSQKIEPDPQLEQENDYLNTIEKTYHTIFNECKIFSEKKFPILKGHIQMSYKVKQMDSIVDSFVQKIIPSVEKLDEYFGNEIPRFLEINVYLKNLLTSFETSTSKTFLDNMKINYMKGCEQLSENIKRTTRYLDIFMKKIKQIFDEAITNLNEYESDERIKVEYDLSISTIFNTTNEINTKIKTYRDEIQQQEIQIKVYINENKTNIFLTRKEENELTRKEEENLRIKEEENLYNNDSSMNSTDSVMDNMEQNLDQSNTSIMNDESNIIINENKTSIDELNEKTDKLHQNNNLNGNIEFNEKIVNEENNIFNNNNISDGNNINDEETSFLKTKLFIWIIITFIVITITFFFMFYIFYYKRNI